MATRNLGLRFGVSVLAVAISGIIIGSHRVGVVGANADDGLSTSKYHPDAGVVGEEAIGIIGGIGARGEEELLESKNKVWTLEEIYQELQVQAAPPPQHPFFFSLSSPLIYIRIHFISTH